jgi:hypothetical protein
MGPATTRCVASNVTSIVSSKASPRPYHRCLPPTFGGKYPERVRYPIADGRPALRRTELDVSLLRAPTTAECPHGRQSRTQTQRVLVELLSILVSRTVSSASSAPDGPRADRQDAPGQRRRVSARLRLSDRRLRSGARPMSPHPDSHHREPEQSNRTTSITGGDISPVVRLWPCLPTPRSNSLPALLPRPRAAACNK